MLHQRQITTDDGTLHLVQGPESGPPLLFMHGVGRSWQDFSAMLTALADTWQVLAIDFRGHGLSSRTPGKYFLRDYVRDCVAVANHLDFPLVLYGHSLGAMTAGLAAAQLGPRVRGAVLEDPPYELLQPSKENSPFHDLFSLMREVSGSALSVSELARKLADSRLPDPKVPGGVRLGDLRDATSIRFGAACLKRVDPTVWDPILTGQLQVGTAYREALPGITCPVLVLQGNPAQGGMVSDAMGDNLAGLIPDCTLVRWPDAGHLIHNLLPERTLRVVREFLDSIALDPASFGG